MSEAVRHAADILAETTDAVAFTGAGISTGSGLPDFRGGSGIWEQFDPADFHVRTLRTDPEAFWERWESLYSTFFEGADPDPNPAHEAMAGMIQDGCLEAVITQNADGLHQAAGTPSDAVIELHGNAKQISCRQCPSEEPVEETIDRLRAGQLPPTCPECDGPLEPDAILFGEQLPEPGMDRARRLALRSDAFLAVGSSLTVEPAASLPELAETAGAALIVDNLDPTPVDDRAAVRTDRPAEEFLPDLRRSLEETGEGRDSDGGTAP
ncbi:MAG: NAD-dependent deacetylase [Halodesulfurarchaeum sp.]